MFHTPSQGKAKAGAKVGPTPPSLKPQAFIAAPPATEDLDVLLAAVDTAAAALDFAETQHQNCFNYKPYVPPPKLLARCAQRARRRLPPPGRSPRDK